MCGYPYVCSVVYVCMCVHGVCCVYMCMCAYVCVGECGVYVCTGVYVCVYVCVHACICCMCMCACMYVCECAYWCSCMCTRVCMCVHGSVCVHVLLPQGRGASPRAPSGIVTWQGSRSEPECRASCQQRATAPLTHSLLHLVIYSHLLSASCRCCNPGGRAGNKEPWPVRSKLF